jgi:hypothetical protein
VGNPLYQNS